jgi:sugar/nucleoside kinase (ribokinase family)
VCSSDLDVIGLGVNALDLIAIIDGYPEPDTKVQFQEFDVQGGGVVATAMAACARLGLRTRYVGKVGGDFWSRVSLRTLSREGIDEVWPRVDLLVCNPGFVRATTGHAALEDGLREMADRGPSRVAVTLAAKGAVGLANGRLVRVPGLRVEAVDTNGAGDVFHGACAFGELRGWPLEWVLTFANAVAAMKCRALGGRRGIPRLPEVAEFLAAHGRHEIARALT